jgi:hypothetical protein
VVDGGDDRHTVNEAKSIEAGEEVLIIADEHKADPLA